MPKIIKGILIMSVFAITCITCQERIENEVILVDSVEISGLHYIAKQDILRGASAPHKNRIAVDIGRLRLILRENMLIKKSKITFDQNNLLIDITEKPVFAGIGVQQGNRIIPGILLDDMTALAGYYKLDIPMILSDESFFRRQGVDSDLNDVAKFLRRIKTHLPEVYEQISTIKPLSGNRVEVTLKGRNTKFEFDVSDKSIDRLRIFAGYIDAKRYFPYKVNIYGDRAVIR
jgi:hypothetical protein